MQGGDCTATGVSADGSRFLHYRFGKDAGADTHRTDGQTAIITLRSSADGHVIQSWTLV